MIFDMQLYHRSDLATTYLQIPSLNVLYVISMTPAYVSLSVSVEYASGFHRLIHICDVSDPGDSYVKNSAFGDGF